MTGLVELSLTKDRIGYSLENLPEINEPNATKHSGMVQNCATHPFTDKMAAITKKKKREGILKYLLVCNN